LHFLFASFNLLLSNSCFCLNFSATGQVCNAYTELNDPVVQRQRFAEQLKVSRISFKCVMGLSLNKLFWNFSE
jgi:uncharacterized membrane protein